MLLQDEQYIVHWLTQYGPLPQTQIVSLLRHKPPEVAAKIIRGLKRQQMIFDIAGGYYLGVDPMGQPDQRIIHAVWVLLQFADKVEPMAHYPAMRRFFAGKLPHIYSDCVLIFRHIYDRNRPERSYRDHDNIELNMVVDIVALYLLPDDAPLRCAHYYCSAGGDTDRTEIYVVPCDSLPDWLSDAKSGALEGVTLYGTYPQ